LAENISAPTARPEPYVADEAEAIAKLYRRLVLLVGAQLLLGVLANMLSLMRAVAGLLALLALPVTIGISIFIAVPAYKLSGRLQAGLPILWAIALFIPCVNILTLLALSSKATTWCRRHGIKVGFFGPTKESIEEIRRSSVTSAFD